MTMRRFTGKFRTLMLFLSSRQAEMNENGAKNAAERARPEFQRVTL